ncbi:MAG: hypothetical protein H0T62_02220 [Parachlamydiaceae bacterium]|nr:hypothetical protein [Parachlamydiaceae bacterium]
MSVISTDERITLPTFSWLEAIKTPLQAKGKRIDGTPFSVEESLEDDFLMTGRKCVDRFIEKGGLFHSVNPFSLHENEKLPFSILLNDEIRPSCSLGWCRSQVLFTKLSEFAPYKITLLHPHATRYGFDPYNDQVNWDEESVPDEFNAWSVKEKVTRIGYENLSEWKKLEEGHIPEDLKPIKEYYDRYFTVDNENQNRRVYITFAANAHVILKRLNEVNKKLDNVVVVHIDLNDLITSPHDNLIPALSVQAFAAFSLLLDNVLDLSALKD